MSGVGGPGDRRRLVSGSFACRLAAAVLLWLGASSVVACGSRSDGGQTGGNTNWIKSCDETADCDDEDACIKGVCLTPCSTDDTCSDKDGTTCSEVEGVAVGAPDCTSAAGDEFCALTCSSNGDCRALGNDYECNIGVCVPVCDVTVDDDTDDDTNPPDDDADDDTTPTDSDCVLVMDSRDCCVLPEAVSRQVFESDECLVEIIEPGVFDINSSPEECRPTACPDNVCVIEPPPGRFGVAELDDEGICRLVAACDDATCIGSPCDPTMGCDPDWQCEGALCFGDDVLTCAADSCGDVGTCVRDIRPPCPQGPSDVVVCECDGRTVDNACHLPSAPIAHGGACTEAE